MTTGFPNYDALSALAEQADFSISMAEAHGQMCGMLCSGAEDFDPLWRLVFLLDDVEMELPGAAAFRQSLDDLLQATKLTLISGDAAARPLLPDAEQPLKIRMMAIRDWCCGFVAGFDLGSLEKPKKPGDQAGEALNDLRDIGRMNISTEESEPAEQALMELEEYLWVAVSLIWLDGAAKGERNDSV